MKATSLGDPNSVGKKMGGGQELRSFTPKSTTQYSGRQEAGDDHEGKYKIMNFRGNNSQNEELRAFKVQKRIHSTDVGQNGQPNERFITEQGIKNPGTRHNLEDVS